LDIFNIIHIFVDIKFFDNMGVFLDLTGIG